MQGNSVVTRGATTQLKKLQDDAAKVAAQLAKTQEDAIGGSAGYVGSVGDILEQSTKPADSTGAGEVKEESGERGTTSAPTGEAVPDPTKVKGRTPQSSTPAPSTPAAPPPTPRVDRTGSGGTNVQVNNTTNSSSTTRGGDNQNVTNPNMKLNAQNEFLTNSLSRQMINVA